MNNEMPHLRPTTTELVRHEAQPIMLSPQPTPAEMMRAMIQSGVTAENVAAFTELVKLSEHMEDRNAEKKFAVALANLQAELPTIVASSIIPNRGKYERFEDVMRQIQPILSKHEFSVTFSNDFKDGRIIETCHLTHGGHTRSNSFAVRVSGKADSETQADCKAATTAKRNALLNALNVIIRQDCLTEEHDAAMEGDAKVTPEQADELERRVALTNSNKGKFLSLAGADSFKGIPASRYAELDQMLRRKEGGR